MLVELVLRDVRLRYRRSVLGIAWSQLSSLAMLGVLTLVFTRVVPLGIEHYAVFVFVGLMAWNLFQSALTAGTASVVAARELVQRPAFPVVLLPLASIASQVVQYVLAVPILLVAIALSTGRVPWTVVLLPAFIAAEVLLVAGPAYLFAYLHVRFRDVGHLLGVVLVPLFYATPVFYAPERAGESFAWVYEWSPLARLLASMRGALVDGELVDLGAVALMAAVGAVVALLAIRLFAAHVHEYAEEL